MSTTLNHGKKNYTRTIVGLGLLTAIVVVLQYISMAIRFGTFSVTLALLPIVVGAAIYGVWAGAWLGFVFGVVVLLTGDAAPFWAESPLGTLITVLVKGTMSGLIAGLVYKILPKNRSFDKLGVYISDALLIIGGIVLLIFVPKIGSNPNLEPAALEKASKFATFCNVFAWVIIALGVALLLYMIIKKPAFSMPIAVLAAAIVSPIVNTGIFLIGCNLFFYKLISSWAGDSNVVTFIFVGLVGLNFFFELAINLVLCPAIVTLVRYGEKKMTKKSA